MTASGSTVVGVGLEYSRCSVPWKHCPKQTAPAPVPIRPTYTPFSPYRPPCLGVPWLLNGNGNNNPASPFHQPQELKQLMALHGGRFENYLYRDAVTHIVCAHLPDTKIKQLAKER